MNNGNKTGFKWLEKLKNVKHIEIYVAVIFIVILLLIFLSTKNSKASTIINNDSSVSKLTVVSYIDNMENNLEGILSNIGGISDVKVMITLDMTEAEVNSSEIDLNKFPDVKGIIVTAKGLNNTALKMKVLQAIEAVIDVKNGNIALLSSD